MTRLEKIELFLKHTHQIEKLARRMENGYVPTVEDFEAVAHLGQIDTKFRVWLIEMEIEVGLATPAEIAARHAVTTPRISQIRTAGGFNAKVSV